MTQEEEQLLFDDLSGRLRYGVICQIDYHDDSTLCGIPNADTFTFCDGVIKRYINQVKPYLRPMDSMTEKEKKEYYATGNVIWDYDTYSEPIIDVFEMTYKTFDWFNKKMFDYRRLIPMGLALEATEGMYK